MSHITLLNRKSLRLAELAPKEESRYTLRAIQITARETVVTDGYILVRVSHPKQEPNNWPVVSGFAAGKEFEQVLLPVDAAKDIAKAIPTKQTIPILGHAAMAVTQDENGAHLQFAVTDLENPRVFTPRAMTRQYPNWQAFIPSKPSVHSVVVNPELLGKLCKYAVEFTKDDNNVGMRLSFGENGSAIRLDVESQASEQGMTALLMSMRSTSDYKLCMATPEPEPIPDPFAGYFDEPIEDSKEAEVSSQASA